MMEQRRQEHPPAGYDVAIASILTCGAALEVPQEELNQVREAWGLEPVELPSPDLIKRLLDDGD
jgi:hypothetical protein